jgi:hypothetical protein
MPSVLRRVSEEDPVNTANLIYLAGVLVAFVVFAVTLARVSRRR